MSRLARIVLFSGLLGFVIAMSASGEQASQDSSQPAEDWRAEVRRLAEARDWAGALRVVDGEIARSPQDLDVKAWRARVLTWAGRLEEAEHTYREILNAEEPAQYDPDHWAGLATVCWREGKLQCKSIQSAPICMRRTGEFCCRLGDGRKRKTSSRKRAARI